MGGAAVADFLNNRPSTGQRPSTRPGTPSTRPTPGDRPGGGDRPNRPGDGNGDRPNRPGGGNGDRPNRPGDGNGDRPNRPGDGNRPNRPGDGDGNRPNRPNRPGDGNGNRPTRPPNRPGNGNRPNRPNRPRPPRPPHWDFHKHHPNYARWNWNRPYRWATWAGLAAFFPWSTGGSEIYYNYGDNIYYEGDEVYQNGEPIATTEEYAEQAQELATNAPEPTDDTEWMTLGVFAATAKDSDSGADPAFYLQLAVSKDGIIGGTVHMSETDKTSTIEGMVDHKSQRAAWAMTGKSSPIMETGIANLTKDDATALLHFEDGTTQQWNLIRLEEPEEDKKK
ncbi:MAG: hypothetical protein K0U82_17495 [Planctomycetes bacterium]|nr:hypothetical protein [Planctomycetota bacterium]